MQINELGLTAEEQQTYYSKREYLMLPIDMDHVDALAAFNITADQIPSYTMGSPKVAVIAVDLQTVEAIVDAADFQIIDAALQGQGPALAFGFSSDGATGTAVVVPEPPTIALLGLATGILLRRPQRLRA